jgi:hypothetical protein
MLADPKQPAWTDKSMKKGKLPMEQKSMGELTEKRKNIAKKLCPFTYSIVPTL